MATKTRDKKQQKSRIAENKKRRNKLLQYRAAIEKANVLNERGISLLKGDQYEVAINVFKQALHLKPENDHILTNYGLTLDKLGLHEQAIEKYKQAWQINHNNFDTLNNWGVALKNLTQYEEAIKKYKQALEINPNYCEALNNYGLALHELGQYEAAIEKYEKALQTRPNDFNCLYNYGLTLLHLSQFEAAAEKFKQALKINANDPDALNNYGTTLIKSEQYEAAIKNFEHVLQISQDHADALNNYGAALLHLGNYNLAIEKFEHAIQSNPDDPGSWVNYGRALIKSGQYNAAIEKYKQAVTITLNFVPESHKYVNFLYLSLGSLYYRIKSETQGNKYFQLAIAHSNDKDAARLQAASDILAVKPYSKEGIAILKEIVTTSPQYAEAFKMLKLNVEPEEFFNIFYDNSAAELHDTENLHRALYHKMLNEVFILKNILYLIARHYQQDDSVFQTAITSLEDIQAGISTRRESAKKLAQEVRQDNYRTRMEIIANTAQDVADFVNNGFFRLKAELHRVKRHIPPEDTVAAELTELIARLEQSENALNDLKSLGEGITIRRSAFKIQQLFETWQTVSQFQHAALRLDIQNGEQEFYGDEQKIRSCINELVENTVKHNPEQSDLQIDIAAYDQLNPLIPNQTLPHNQPYLVIQVKDNGKGVPPDKKDWIFLPLKTTAPHGSGLGLAIIQRTLRKMDGYITETGTDGADFFMYIPYAKETL